MPMSPDEQIKYKKLYMQTAKEYVDELHKNLILLKRGKEKKNSIEALHRAAHSLTSQSTMMSYQAMSASASLLERIFEEKERVAALTYLDNYLDILIGAVANMNLCLDSLSKTDQESDLTDDIAKLQKIAGIPL
jgi:chemotaxis protein histidine kinase CheA